MKEKREKRLESEFRKEIYGILSTDIKDPEMTEMFSITDCRVNNDLSEAVVFVSVFSTDKEKAEKTFSAIKRAAPTVRSLISRRMHIRTVPKFNFVLDTSEEYGARIDRIIDGFTYGEKNDD